MIIYKLTNTINGKIYIGQTTRTLRRRFIEHARPSRKALVSKAMHKYGLSAFTAEVIEKAVSIEDLNELEIKWIRHYDCMSPNGYNQCHGGDNSTGFKHREETKRTISAKRSGILAGEENPFFGKTHTEDQKAKWRIDRKGRDTSKATEASFEKTRIKVINLTTLEVFDSVSDAATKYGVPVTNISRACRVKTRTAKGCRWQYLSDHDNTVPSPETGRCND